MMQSLGYRVYFYGSSDSDVHCDKHLITITAEERTQIYGEYDYKTTFFKCEVGDKGYTLFNERARALIQENAEPGLNVICAPFGIYHQPAVQGLKDTDTCRFVVVETGIGYSGVFAQHRVFESSEWMHYIWGRTNVQVGQYGDAVIPNYYPIDSFRPEADPSGGYLLFIGRLIERKGLHIAMQVATTLKRRLVVAGQGDVKPFLSDTRVNSTYIDYVGTVGCIERRTLMANADAVLVPTQYIGPFEGVNAEAQLCGTPVVTSGFGIFNTSVLQGVTGYRCQNFAEYCEAVIKCGFLNRRYIHERAVALWDMDIVKHQYAVYFSTLLSGWY
jgi:glycosyltransferase involved in cell wall biosynthesis